jgi:translation initiation factor IF-1
MSLRAMPLRAVPRQEWLQPRRPHLPQTCEEGRTKADFAGGPLEAGLVEEVLPSGMYRVRIGDGRVLRVGVDAACRATLVKLIAGDRVELRIAARDPSRGQIVRKL